MGPDDVLVGKGSPSCGNSGNIRFRAVVKMLLPLYISTSRRSEKDRLARSVVDIIRSRNGRFLRRIDSPSEADQLKLATYDGVWLLVDEKLMIPKVKQTFRDEHSGASKNEVLSAAQTNQDSYAGLDNQRNVSTTFSALLSPISPPFRSIQNESAVFMQRFGIELGRHMFLNTNAALWRLQQQHGPTPCVDSIHAQQSMNINLNPSNIDDGLHLLASAAASRSTIRTLTSPEVRPSEKSKRKSNVKSSK